MGDRPKAGVRDLPQSQLSNCLALANLHPWSPWARSLSGRREGDGLVLIRLLGPVDLVDDVGDVRVSTSAIRRTLLALLALNAGRVLSADWLLEHAWNGDVPESGRRALRFHISHLRRELGDQELVETCPGGYRLRVAPREVDTFLVEALGRAAREEPDDNRAAQLCVEALTAWRGEPFVDASPSADLADEAERLGELRLSLTELGCRRRFDAGEAAELVAELVRLTGDHPLRERLWQVLIAAQYRTGRQADALRSYDTVRSILVETLGIEPSPELQELRRRVLNQDPTLDSPPGRPQVLMLWDVEGATGLLVRRGQAGIAVLAKVAELVSVVARERGGRVSTSQGEGDGAVVLFGCVSDAIDAAVEINRRMSKEPWPDGELVAIRSAIHVGVVTVTAEGVFGSEVHRCARLRGLADDGEVFLSDEAAQSAGQALPDGCSVIDEGSVILHGSRDPESVWRLVHPALRTRQRAVRGTTASVTTVPIWRTSFVGRSRDVATVGGLLEIGRLVTLVGPAGVGKTRLAAAVAGDTSGRACFVDLSVAASDREVDELVADVLGSTLAAAPRAGIAAALHDAPTLLVLDNCEHVLDAVASLVEFVLAGCAASSVLATSRSALRVPDEEVFVVSPLPTGARGAAVQLFIDRAGATRGQWTADNSVLAQIEALTSLLDGVPLAIELAAARVTAFSVGEILTLLQRDLAGLGDTRRRGPDRHRTLQAAIESSVRMLSDAERRLLCRLAMLPGSFRLSTATAATGAGEGHERLLVTALPILVEQSLLTAEYGKGPTRYRMLEMIRSVVQAELDASERKEVLDRLLVHCVDQVDGIEGPVPLEAGFEEEVARDAALYRAAVEHAIATDQIGPGLRLVYGLFVVWRGRMQRSTLDRWMTDLVELTDAPNSMRASVLRRQALIASDDLGDHERAIRLFDLAEADAIAVNDRSLLGRIWANRAVHDLVRGRYDGVERRLRDAAALLEESGDPYVADTQVTLACVYARQARFDQANELLTRAAAADMPWFFRINTELIRTLLALKTGNVDSASEYAAKTLDMAERSEDPDLIHGAVLNAAMAALARGETALARELCVRTVAIAREHDLRTEALAVAGLAIVSVLLGDLDLARKCRDEIVSQPPATRWLEIADGRLACSFVDLADGDADGAERGASEVLADAEREENPYVHLLSLELIAASVAATDPPRARELLDAADGERSAMGATAWPLEPYRHVALQTLEAPPADRAASRTPQ